MSEADLTADTEPEPDDLAGAERWIGYLDWLRSDIIRAVLALSPQEQRHSRLTSGWTPLELLSHVLHMEQRWFVWGFLAEPVDEPYGDWTPHHTHWQVPAEVTAERLVARLEQVADRTRTVIRRHGMATPAAPGGRFETAPTPTLEWICLHVVAEYARHAGHLDIVSELANGANPES